MLSNCNCIATLPPTINSSPSGAPALTSSLLSAGRCERSQIRSPRDKLNKKVGSELHSFTRDAPRFQFFFFSFRPQNAVEQPHVMDPNSFTALQNEKCIISHLFTAFLKIKISFVKELFKTCQRSTNKKPSKHSGFVTTLSELSQPFVTSPNEWVNFCNVFVGSGTLSHSTGRLSVKMQQL